MLRAAIVAAALAPFSAGAATLGLTTGAPFLVGESEQPKAGAVAGGSPGGTIGLGDLGWNALYRPGETNEIYSLGYSMLVHPDDTVSHFQLFIDDHLFVSPPLFSSYTFSGFGFSGDTLEFLLTEIVSAKPWVGSRVLMTVSIGRDLAGGAFAAMLADIEAETFDTGLGGWSTHVALANVLAAPVPASLPLLLSGLGLLGLRRRHGAARVTRGVTRSQFGRSKPASISA